MNKVPEDKPLTATEVRMREQELGRRHTLNKWCDPVLKKILKILRRYYNSYTDIGY